MNITAIRFRSAATPTLPTGSTSPSLKLVTLSATNTQRELANLLSELKIGSILALGRIGNPYPVKHLQQRILGNSLPEGFKAPEAVSVYAQIPNSALCKLHVLIRKDSTDKFTVVNTGPYSDSVELDGQPLKPYTGHSANTGSNLNLSSFEFCL